MTAATLDDDTRTHAKPACTRWFWIIAGDDFVHELRRLRSCSAGSGREMQDAIGFREIDASRDARLKALTDTRHGALLLSAAAWTTRTFELSSPWAAGLRFVGAEAQSPSAPGIVPVATKFNLAGGGLTFEDAFASCLGEC